MLNTWIKLVLDVVNTPPPMKKKRVKLPDKPSWLTNDIQEANKHRDHLKKLVDHEKIPIATFNKARTKVVVNKAKSVAIENELEGNKQNSRLLWKALKKLSSSGKVKSVPNDLKASRDQANLFNKHFVSITSTIVNNNQPATPDLSHIESFVNDRKPSTTNFEIPLLDVNSLDKLTVGANFFPLVFSFPHLLVIAFMLLCYAFSLSGISLITLLCYVLYVNFVIVCYLAPIYYQFYGSISVTTFVEVDYFFPRWP